MKERPILFSTPMVQAILEGRKTQTRRIVKDPHQQYPVVAKHLSSCEFDFHYDQGVGQFTACPYGKPGDRLWVRETWTPGYAVLDDPNMKYWCFKDGGQKYSDGKYFPPLKEYSPGAFAGIKWKPSIFMPREACRIILEVTDVRVERLQDILEEDAKAEGIKLIDQFGGSYVVNRGRAYATAKLCYAELWESINGKGSWDKNPWVWVIEFRKVQA